ncbi:hypothetical protein EV421DRAFT_2022436 [Armillaria borealis]|uniref:Uncharacterized protein n=1 Tax=Armillaria borealis TaxID=47425 RepID=A0AA39J7F2_9AGAR|nr:hypothetical protein EV421DRAFT_2022436 [Armillaria borealis]
MPILGATSGSVSTFRPKVLWRGVYELRLQKHCHCYHWPEARWRFSMSIIQDDFTGAIVSRPISIKRAPPLGSSSCLQLSLSRAVVAAFQLLGHAVEGGQCWRTRRRRELHTPSMVFHLATETVNESTALPSSEPGLVARLLSVGERGASSHDCICQLSMV